MLQAFMRAEKFCKLSWVPVRVYEAGRRLLGSHKGHYKLLQTSGDLPERLSKRAWGQGLACPSRPWGWDEGGYTPIPDLRTPSLV